MCLYSYVRGLTQVIAVAVLAGVAVSFVPLFQKSCRPPQLMKNMPLSVRVHVRLHVCEYMRVFV